MASVVFIIRVPKAEDKTEREGSNQIDLENVEKKKIDSPKDDINGQANDANRADDTAEDVEILTDINWAEVFMQHDHCSKTIVARSCVIIKSLAIVSVLPL